MVYEMNLRRECFTEFIDGMHCYPFNPHKERITPKVGTKIKFVERKTDNLANLGAKTGRHCTVEVKQIFKYVEGINGHLLLSFI